MTEGVGGCVIGAVWGGGAWVIAWSRVRMVTGTRDSVVAWLRGLRGWLVAWVAWVAWVAGSVGYPHNPSYPHSHNYI